MLWNIDLLIILHVWNIDLLNICYMYGILTLLIVSFKYGITVFIDYPSCMEY